VTGGASASYGTDAVAGVVNVILDTKFEGIKLSAQGGETARHDGPTDKFSITAGHQFGDKLHIVGSLSEFNQDPIDSFASLQSRPWINQTAEVSGRPGGPTYQIAPYVIPTNFSYNGTVVLPGQPINGMQFSPDGRSLLPAPVGVLGAVGDSCQCLATKNETYGVNSGDQLEGGYTRKNAFVHVTYDVSDSLQVYGQGMFSDDVANNRYQSADLVDSWQAPVDINNPFLSPGVRSQILGALQTQYPAGTVPGMPAGYHYVYPGNDTLATQYFNYGIYLPSIPGNPLGETRLITANNTKQGTVGFKGEFREWKIDGYFNKGETIEDYVDYNGTRVDRLFFAMDAITGPNGSPMCRVASQQYDPQYYKSFADCVPINLFGGMNQISPQAAAYVSGPTKDAKQYYDLTNGELSANGTLFKGFGAGPVKA
jgi:outer membrane receptor protein involved in Fe transport